MTSPTPAQSVEPSEVQREAATLELCGKTRRDCGNGATADALYRGAAMIRELHREWNEQIDQLTALQSRYEAAIAALRKYGGHQWGCNTMTVTRVGDRPRKCTCGYNKALAQPAAAQPKGEV
jgi:hypothetical protein